MLPNSNQPGDDAGGGGGSTFLSRLSTACGCDNLVIPFASRWIMIIGLIGSVLALFGFDAYTSCWPIYIIYSFGLQFYRLFTSSLLPNGLLMGLISLFTFFQTTQHIESSRGTVWFAMMHLYITLLANLLLTFLFILFYMVFGWSYSADLTSSGLWPSIFGFMVIDYMNEPEQPRQFMCFPVHIPSKYYPLALFAIFTLFMLGLDGGMFCGLIVGYILHARQNWMVSQVTAQRWEQKSWMNSIREQPNFVSSSVNGVVNSGEWVGSSSRSDNSSSSSRFGSIFNSSSDSAAPSSSSNTATPSVFLSGGGHRLGGPSAAATGPSAFPPPSAPSASSTTTASSAEARQQRLAAIEQRLNKSNNPSITSATSPKSSISPPPSSVPKLPAPTSSPPSSSTMTDRDRPPSPSGFRPSAVAAPSSAFSLGTNEDSDDDIYADHIESNQGFVPDQTKSTKKGYSQVQSISSPLDDTDELELSPPPSSSTHHPHSNNQLEQDDHEDHETTAMIA